MLVIGLTGGTGAGKSEVARLLAERGAVVVSADKLGHEAYEPQTEGWEQVVGAFGPGVLTGSGEIDRQRLGGIVFADRQRLEVLNGIVHPIIGAGIRDAIESLRGSGAPAAVVDAALLLEAGWDAYVDEVWVAVASEDAAAKRVAGQGRLTEDEVRTRIRSQMTQAERIERASVVIDNNEGVEELRERVAEVWRQRVEQRR